MIAIRKDKQWPATAKIYLNLQKEWYTNIAVSITSFIVLWVYRNYIPFTLQFSWLTGQLLFLFLRYYNARLLQKYLLTDERKKVQVHTRNLLFLIIYSAILWDIIVALGFKYAPETYALFAYILIAGLINGAILSLSSLVNIYIVYFLLPEFK